MERVGHLNKKGKENVTSIPTSLFPTFPPSTVKNADHTSTSCQTLQYMTTRVGKGSESKAAGKGFVGDKTQLEFGT